METTHEKNNIEEEEEEKKKKKFAKEESSKMRINTQSTSNSTGPSLRHSESTCDGDVCSFNPNRFDEPKSFTPTSTHTPTIETPKFNSQQEPCVLPNKIVCIESEVTSGPWGDTFEHCVKDVCISAFDEAHDCVEGDGKTCEKPVDDYFTLSVKVLEKSKKTFYSQLIQVHVLALKSASRISGESLVYFDNYGDVKEAIYDIGQRVIYSTVLQVSLKTIYDSTVEVFVQFCCGEKTPDYVPGLDKIMGSFTVLASIKNDKESRKRGMMIGVKEVAKTYGTVVLASVLTSYVGEYVGDGAAPYVASFVSSVVVNLIDRGMKALFSWWNKK